MLLQEETFWMTISRRFTGITFCCCSTNQVGLEYKTEICIKHIPLYLIISQAWAINTLGCYKWIACLPCNVSVHF